MIKQIQQLLKDAGYYHGKIDGIIGKMTVQAVQLAIQQAKQPQDTQQQAQDTQQDTPQSETPPKNKPSGYILDERSLKSLEGVNDKLVQVVKRAIEITEQDFVVIEGVRSREQCMINYGKGRTASQCLAKGVPAKYARPNERKVTWLSDPFASKHCKQSDGYGHAVDICPKPIDWDDYTKFDKIAKAMLTAGRELGVNVRWGADWDSDGKPRERGEGDSPHFEI